MRAAKTIDSFRVVVVITVVAWVFEQFAPSDAVLWFTAAAWALWSVVALWNVGREWRAFRRRDQMLTRGEPLR